MKASGHVRMERIFDAWVPRKMNQMDYTMKNLWWNIMRFVIEERYPDPDIY